MGIEVIDILLFPFRLMGGLFLRLREYIKYGSVGQ
jgi:hypothetical protein